MILTLLAKQSPTSFFRIRGCYNISHPYFPFKAKSNLNTIRES